MMPSQLAADPALSATFAQLPVAAEQTMFVTPRGSNGNDGLTLKSAKATLAAAITALGSGSGVVTLGFGTIPLGAELPLVAGANGDDFSYRGLTIRGMGIGLTKVDASATSGITALHMTSAGKMAINLEDFELVGPGYTNAGSRGIFWEAPGGSYLWQNLYVRDFETGIEFYDSTLGTSINVNVRHCGTGLSTGYNTDIHSWIGCRFDYNTLGIRLGTPMLDHPSGSQEENALSFRNCRISNNTKAFFVDDYGCSGIEFDHCYFEGNAKEGDVGVSGRSDSSAPVGIVFAGCYWDSYTLQAEGISVYNNAALSFENGCKAGSADYTVFCKLYQTTSRLVVTPDNSLAAGTGVINYNTLNYAVTGGLRIGISDVEAIAGGGLSVAWKQNQMANGTGKIWEAWTRRSSSDNSVLGDLRVQDIGGVLQISGAADVDSYITATSRGTIATADVNHRGSVAIVRGASAIADTTYVCERNGDQTTYSWWPTTRLATFTTAGRPTAAIAGAGRAIFDTTLGKPTWSDGTNWKDAAGTNV
jgi:hypothetical protein